MAPSRYLATVFALFAALVAAAALYAWSEAGRATAAGYANCAYIARKLELGRTVPSPKLVVVAGSNAAAGIDVGAISGALDVPAFNFSLFATFSPAFALFQARKILREGDAVLLAFEYLAYEYEAPSNALVDTVYSCGADYWLSLDWPRRLRYVFAVRPQRFFSILRFNGATAESARTMVETAIAENGNLAIPFAGPTPESGSHRPLVIRFRAASNGAARIADFVRWAKGNGIAVFATWPNTLYFREYDSSPAFGQIADFYRSLGVETIGSPQDAMVASEYLAETIYHLTRPGIAMRTGVLIERLRSDPAFLAWRERTREIANGG